jgi:hypothetical protein
LPSSSGLVFTIEVDGRPTVAFEAMQLREASELCQEQWLRDDLCALRSNGAPLCGISSKLKARVAKVSERELYREAADVTTPSDDIVLVYLVDLDAP